MIEGGFVEMKREYIKPEAEMMKFVEAEEIMTNPGNILSNPDMGTMDNVIWG